MPPSKTRNRPLRKVNKTRKVIRTIYDGVSGFCGAEGFKNATYGEMKIEGVEKLVTAFQKLGPIESYPEGKRTFYDLGSGIGQIVLAVAHFVPQIQARGIEQVPKRVAAASAALEKVSKEVQSRVHFTEGSFLDSSVDLSDLCWSYVSNLCSSADVNRRLAEKLNRECPVGCIIACSIKLPFGPQWKDQGDLAVEMSWNNSSTIHLFSRVQV